MKYAGSILLHSVFVIIAIVLMFKGLNEYWTAILLGYFVIPAVIFVINYNGYYEEARKGAMDYLGEKIKEYHKDKSISDFEKIALIDILVEESEMSENEKRSFRLMVNDFINDSGDEEDDEFKKFEFKDYDAEDDDIK